MSAVEALIWFVCMTTAVFATIAVGVFLAARSGSPHLHREHPWAHALAHPRLPSSRHRDRHA